MREKEIFYFLFYFFNERKEKAFLSSTNSLTISRQIIIYINTPLKKV